MAMARSAFKRKHRRRRRVDMESIKFCNQSLTVTFDTPPGAGDCDNPVVTQFALIRPAEIGQIPGRVVNIIDELDPTKGILFGGLTGDLQWDHDPFNDNPEDTSFGFIRIWEAIHVQALDEFGFPTYLPRLSDSAIGVDRDVDLVWKRTSSIPIWSAGVTCTSTCQLTAQNQNQHDHIRIKSRRRLTEKQSLCYSVAFTRDPIAFWGQSPDFGHRLNLNGWLRIAVRNI